MPSLNPQPDNALFDRIRALERQVLALSSVRNSYVPIAGVYRSSPATVHNGVLQVIPFNAFYGDESMINTTAVGYGFQIASPGFFMTTLSLPTFGAAPLLQLHIAINVDSYTAPTSYGDIDSAAITASTTETGQHVSLFEITQTNIDDGGGAARVDALIAFPTSDATQVSSVFEFNMARLGDIQLQ